MGKPSKFSKLAGPQRVLYASLDAATPTLATDTVVFLQSGTAKKVTFANMMAGVDGTVTSTGLSSTNGVLSVNIAGLDAKTAPVAADSVMICDSENSNVLKEVTFTQAGIPLSTVMAGTGLMDATGSIALDLDGCGDANIDVAADTIAFIDESATGDPTKLESVVDFVAGIGGVAATTGLSNSNGVLTVAAKIGHLVAGEASSLFFVAGEVDQTSASAVDYKLSDAIPAKGKLVAAFLSVTQAANGDNASVVVSVCKAAACANKMCGDFTITKTDTAYTNKIGNCLMSMPVTGADNTQLSGEDVYVYCPANTNKTTGKVFVFLVFQIVA